MRRRNVKNAHERLMAGHEVVIVDPTIHKGKWHQVFNNNNPIYVEIGMGKGDFILGNAVKNPDINYLGIEKFEGVILQAVKKAEELQLSNVKLICMDAEKLEEVFALGEVDKLFLNFSDPWPKSRHAKRRLTHEHFLNVYLKIIKKEAEIEFKTDNKDLFAFSLISINQQHWNFLDVSLDLHSELERGEIIMTEYEKKFHALGHPIYYLKFNHRGE